MLRYVSFRLREGIEEAKHIGTMLQLFLARPLYSGIELHKKILSVLLFVSVLLFEVITVFLLNRVHSQLQANEQIQIFLI